VFTARRGRTGERVAVKVLPLRTYRARAEAEAQVSTIDHPRLVNVHESIVDERRGVVGLVMDLASDGDLRSALRSGAGPTPLEMFQITDDVLAALEALHAVGLLHRDVKPENVLLERVGGVMRARLGDLGIARPIDRTRSTGSVLGTDLYIAPEVHDGSAPSPASDLWAVGYVMYEGLFGAPPHADAATSYQAIGRLRAEGPDRPPRVPDDLWRVVSALLAPEPADRPRSAREARTLLRTAREAAEAASTAVDEPKTLVRPGARRRSTARDNESGLMRPVPAAYDRAPAVARALSVAASVLLIVGGLAWLGGRADLGGSGDDAAQVISAVEPLTPDSAAVVPTQYRWRLDHGVLSGHRCLSCSPPARLAAAGLRSRATTGRRNDRVTARSSCISQCRRSRPVQPTWSSSRSRSNKAWTASVR
jgi:serine/threonine-protein kinase